MPFLLNSFGTFGTGAATTYFVVAGAAEATGNITLAGMQAGDIAVFFGSAVTSAPVMSGETSLVTGSFKISWKTITPTDVANGYIAVTMSGTGGCAVGVYRGPTAAFAINWGTNDNITASPVVCPGITKNASSKVVVYGFTAYTAAETVSVTGPTQRAISANGRGWIGDFDTSALYTNGTSESFSYPNLATVAAMVAELR